MFEPHRVEPPYRTVPHGIVCFGGTVRFFGGSIVSVCVVFAWGTRRGISRGGCGRSVPVVGSLPGKARTAAEGALALA